MSKKVNKIDLEHMSSDEKKKLVKLLKEKAEKGDTSNLNWMYSGDSLVDREDYLLGKRVKDMNEISLLDSKLGSASNKVEEIDQSLVERCAKVDMESKMREDPLMLIRQSEDNERKRLMQNKVKMKKLRNLVSEQQRRQERKEKKKHKKQKSRKQSRNNHNSSSSSESSGDDDDLLNQYVSLIQNAMTDAEKPTSSKKSRDKGGRGSSPPHRRPSPERRQQHRGRRSPERRRSIERRRYSPVRKRSPPPDYRSSRHGRHAQEEQRRWHPSTDRDARRHQHRSRSKSRSPRHSQPERRTLYEQSSHKVGASKYSAEEMAKLRSAMENNARQEAEKRVERIEKYRELLKEEEEQEAAQRRTKSSSDSDEDKSAFVSRLVMQHAASSTVEDNIKRRLHYQQKGQSANDAKALTKRN